MPWITNSTGTAPVWAVPVASTGTWTTTAATTVCAVPTFAWSQQQVPGNFSPTNATTAADTIYVYMWQEGLLVDHQQYLALAMNRVQAAHVRTEEQAAEMERVLAAREERRLLRNAATARSRQLLLDHLTPAQRKTFERHNWFLVEGGKTKKRYRIRTDGYTGNIDVFDGEMVTHRLCVHCVDDIPLYDHHLAQKLSLQYDEEHILQIANRRAA